MQSRRYAKERSILKREYMTGLSLNAYILSKISVLGILCILQSILIVGVFYYGNRYAGEGSAGRSFS